MNQSHAFGKSKEQSFLGGLFRSPAQSQHRSLKTQERHIEALVLLVQEGDSEAFTKLYNIFITPLFRYVYYRVSSGEVEDLLEIVFLKVWQHIDQYRPGENFFSAWIYRIAHNVIIDHYRAMNGSGTNELSDNMADEKRDNHSTNKISQTLTQETLRHAIARLKENYQQILVLKYLNELSNEEIEQILLKSQNAIRILLFRALRALKKELLAMGITQWET